MADYTASDHPAVVDLLFSGGGVIGTPATLEHADWIDRQISAAVPVPVLYGGRVDPNHSLEFAKLKVSPGFLSAVPPGTSRATWGSSRKRPEFVSAVETWRQLLRMLRG